jgi:adenylate cyclase
VTERDKKRVRDAFSHYVSAELLGKLIEQPGRLKLGGEKKNMTFLFADIRRFTSLAEKLDAVELVQFINRFLTPMSAIVLEKRGTIDKYMGDCIMAFWNAPLDDPDHAAHACDAALAMRDRLITLNDELRAEAAARGKIHAPVHIGIGVNTGDCCIGNIGSEQRFDYSVLGDSVNLASRLEAQTKVYHTDIIIGESTQALAPGFATLEIDRILVRGKKQPARLFALLGGAELKNSPAFIDLEQKHRRMLEAYREKDWPAASRLLEECIRADNRKMRLRVLYALYKKRIRAGAEPET